MQLFDDLEDFGTFDDAVSGDVRDPYTDLARMRREEPVQRLDTSAMPHEESKPVFMVYRYEEVAQVLRDNETFSSAIILDFFGDALGKHVMLGMDEPEHRRHRALVSASLLAEGAGASRARSGRAGGQRADRPVRRPRACRSRSRVHVPVPHADHRRPSRPAPRGLSAVPAVVDLAAQHHSSTGSAASPPRKALREYFIPILAARREEPRDDLISSLAQAEIDGEKLADEEIFSFLRLLLPAGVETTYRSTGNLLFGLLSNPDQLDAVRSDRSLIPQAIEEAVRWEPPLLVFTRVATRDTELAGCTDPGRLLGHAHARLGQPGRRALGGSRPLRHLPPGEAPHRFRLRGARVPRNAPGPARDARRPQPPIRPPAQPASRSRRRRSAHPGPGLPVADVATRAVRDASRLRRTPEKPEEANERMDRRS